ncbi:unnamed protein product [Lampetra fluviatilis]
MEDAGSGLAGQMKDRLDPYGFEFPADCDPSLEAQRESLYLPVLARRAVKWDKLLRRQRQPGGAARLRKAATVKRYVRKGVPNAHRGDVWMATSGAQANMEANVGYYARLLAHEKDPVLVDTIATDLNRTFPENVYFQDGAQPSLKESLGRVLASYGHHNDTVGYCQGMNFLAGYLLIVTRSEEKSFWLMDALIGRILPDYYTRDMLGVRVDQEVLGELLATKLPHVAAHVVSHGVPWPLLTARWFLCLYVDVLPVETVLRVWDSLFYEGSKVLFRVAVTLVRHHQAQVLAASGFPAVVTAFRAMAAGSFARDCHTFMQRTFVDPGSLPMATITAQRDSIRARLLQEAESTSLRFESIRLPL